MLSQYGFQGCSLRNTEYIVGAVIFTGHETKVSYPVSIVDINGFIWQYYYGLGADGNRFDFIL